jgi:hypothetical protein
LKDYHADLKLAPSSITQTLNTQCSWTKKSGPNSGQLQNTQTTIATFQKPEKGGHYVFDCYLQQHEHTDVQVLLPLGGPNVTAYYLSECARYDNWLTTMKARLNAKTSDTFVKGFLIAAYFSRTVAAMNHKYGTYETAESPCRKYGTNTVTISEYVFFKDQLGNFLFSYLAARTGFTFGATRISANLAGRLIAKVPDNPDDQAAYTAGYAFGQNPTANFKDILESKDIRKMQDVKQGTSSPLYCWPSEETASGSTYPTWGATAGGGIINPDPQ